MLLLISPAKTLDLTPQEKIKDYSQPQKLKESAELVEILKKQSPKDLAKLMSISDKLAAENYSSYQSWQRPFTLKNAKQAIFAFKGDVYIGLDAEQFTQKQLEYAQQHLLILSGLYGALRPLDLMQAYRLEMGTKLNNAKGKDLYEFWDNKVSKLINKQLAEQKIKTVLNLASNEYFNVVNTQLIEANIISPEFKDYKNGKYKIISFFAKKARGLMAAWVVKHKVKSYKKLTQFDVQGYYYDEASSTPKKPVFLRDEPV